MAEDRPPAGRRSPLSVEVDLNADGRGKGFVRLPHSTHESAYGFIPLPIVCIRNGEGPTALLMGGNHGDEYEGQVAVAALARSLDPASVRGRVICLPALNLPAAVAGRRTSPVDGGNLNRCFPGDPEGSPTQQIAWFIEHEILPLCDVVCDLHSGGSSLAYLPTAVVRRSPDPVRFRRSLDLLRAFGAPVSFIPQHVQGAQSTLTGAAERQSVLSISSELGGAGAVSREGLAIAERGLRNVLRHAGILLPEPEPVRREMSVFEVGGAEHFVYAPDPGVFEPLADLGEAVVAGQVAALIHFVETPWLEPKCVRFHSEGTVLCKRVPGRTGRGDCLFHLGIKIDLDRLEREAGSTA